MTPAPDLGDIVRHRLRTTFTEAVAEGRAKPLVIPYSILGAFIVPTLWLAIPHTKRPWVYQTRWLVVAFVIAFDVHVMRTTASTNLGFSYAAGLCACWGILSTLHLLVWTRPQFDAARAVRAADVDVTGPRKLMNGGSLHESRRPQEEGVRQRRPTPQDDAGDETQESSDYVWQRFPEDAPLSQRLNWALDLTTSLRCLGWTYSVTCVPRPEIPPEVRPNAPVDISCMPKVSRSGYERCLTEREFVWQRLRALTVMYLTLDFLAVFMMKDAFFFLGPGHGFKLSSHIGWMPPSILLLYRELFSLIAIICAIAAVFYLNDMVQYYCLRSLFPIRGELWQYTTTFGAFSHVLDRGLAGWWGAWWHQTFRLQFIAPCTYLIKNGYLVKGSPSAKMVAFFASFGQSALLHASGSISTIPETKIWRAPVFFLLQIPGIVLNQLLLTASKSCFPRLPRRLIQLGNLLFSFSWMYLTARFFVDDLASSGLWLLEPIPISPLRWLGVGHPDDHWWRWDREHLPKWHTGEHWWESGVAL